MAEEKGNRWLIGVVVILVIALVGALCVGAGALVYLNQQSPAASATRVAPATSPASTANNGNVLRLPGGTGGGQDPPTLDPVMASDAESAVYVAEIFSGLVTLDQNLKISPDLASSWDVSADRMTYTFHLRPNATFHDGRPVTAQDVQYSIERAANPATASPTAETYLGDIVGVKDKLNRKAASVEGVKVIDDHTLQITIDAPKAYFLAKLTFPAAYVVDKNNVERGGATWTDKPNGTGPYKLQEYVRGQRIVLVKNDNFYLDPKPQIPEVDFILGGGSFMTMYENGDLESALVGINDIDRVNDPTSPLNKELFVGPQLSTCFIVFNVNKPPFDDPKVRQAFSLAINRQQMVDVVTKKMDTVANSILPPGMPGYVQPPAPVFDAAQAKQVLSQSKYANNMPDITWTTAGAGGAAPSDIQAMTAMIKDGLGIDVSIQQSDWATFIGQLDNPATNPYQMFDICWIADYSDPQNFLDILFHSGNSQNWSDYNNPEVDKLLDQAGVAADTTTRFQLYHQAEQTILADNPVIPLFYQQQHWLTKPYVKGLIYPPLIIPRLRYASLSK
jgi:ABC-type transport system substrate-binding protein